jgi:hypothetical protein
MLRDIYIYLGLCDPTCWTCDGNGPNNCLSCNGGLYDPINKTCQCPGGSIFSNNICVTTAVGCSNGQVLNAKGICVDPCISGTNCEAGFCSNAYTCTAG